MMRGMNQFRTTGFLAASPNPSGQSGPEKLDGEPRLEVPFTEEQPLAQLVVATARRPYANTLGQGVLHWGLND
jgi:hypothetical protein